MNTAHTLTPLLRNSIGFDRFGEVFESILNSDTLADGYPPYDIEKRGEDEYAISMAVAGFQREDLSIEVHNNQLTIKGRLEDRERDGVEYLHRGIATRAFEHSFRLAEFMRITGADISNGLLTVRLVRELPEEQKPRRIPIRALHADSALELAGGEKKAQPEEQLQVQKEAV